MTRGTSRSAPTDPDAQTPGHLPEELPDSASLGEQAWVPGRWYPGEGEPLDDEDQDRLGDPVGMPAVDETDGHMEGDGLGNGIPGPGEENMHISDHLRTGEEKTSLGTTPDDTMRENVDVPLWMVRELKRFMMQEDGAGGSLASPVDAKGFYSDFDMNKDHNGTDDLSSTWYKSPGRTPGEDGDPFRGTDPYAQLGFHPPKGQNDPTASPPAVDGEEGIASRLTPPIWQLSAGSDTSKVLGANAKPAAADGESEDGEGEEDEDGEGGEGVDEEGGPPEGKESR